MKNYKELENEKTRGKKRYLERVQEEKEAEQELRDFVPEEPTFPDNNDQRLS